MANKLAIVGAVAGVVGAVVAAIVFITGKTSLVDLVPTFVPAEQGIGEKEIDRAILQVTQRRKQKCLMEMTITVRDPGSPPPPVEPEGPKPLGSPECAAPNPEAFNLVAAVWGETGCANPIRIRVERAPTPQSSRNADWGYRSRIYAALNTDATEWVVGGVFGNTIEAISTRDASIWKFQLQDGELWIEDSQGKIRRMSPCTSNQSPK